MRVLITGINGFLGGAIASRLLIDEDYTVRGLGRKEKCEAVPDYHAVDLRNEVDWKSLLDGVDVIVHCAAIAEDKENADVSGYRRINVDAALNLAKNAEKMGVRRFVFVSSVKAVAEQSLQGCPLNETDIESPASVYGETKLEAERGLKNILSQSKMELVIVRLPLVYGSRAKGNFLSLVKIARSGVPLPFGGIKNLRSFISVDNFVDFVMCCINNKNAAGNTFFVSDGHDLSVGDTVRLIRKDLEMNPRLFYVPVGMLYFFARLTGRSSMMDRLCGILQVDISKSREVMGWCPPYPVEHEFRKAVSGLIGK